MISLALLQHIALIRISAAEAQRENHPIACQAGAKRHCYKNGKIRTKFNQKAIIMDSTEADKATTQSRAKTGKFLPGQSGNPGGRPKRESILRTQLAAGSDDAIAQVINAATEGDMTACRLILERTVPVRKASYEAVAFELDDSSLADAAKSVLRAVAAGDLSPDVGAMLITAVNNTAKIVEVDELERRLAALEGDHHEAE